MRQRIDELNHATEHLAEMSMNSALQARCRRQAPRRSVTHAACVLSSRQVLRSGKWAARTRTSKKQNTFRRRRNSRSPSSRKARPSKSTLRDFLTVTTACPAAFSTSCHGFPYGPRPRLRRRLRLLHLSRDRPRGPGVLQRSQRTPSSISSTKRPASRRNRALAASAFPTARRILSSKFRHGIKITPRKRNTDPATRIHEE